LEEKIEEIEENSQKINENSENSQVFHENEENLMKNLENMTHSMLLAIQKIYKKFEAPIVMEKNDSSDLVHSQLIEKMHSELTQDIAALNIERINEKLEKILAVVFSATTLRVKQFESAAAASFSAAQAVLAPRQIFAYLAAHKLAGKMLSIMPSVFLELTTKGFCVPQDLLSGEEQKEENDTKADDECEDCDGEKNVLDKLDSEDQLDEARKPEDYNDKGEKEEDCREHERNRMSDDFDVKMQEV
jgi:midasin